jgi:hypothetical protein
MGKVFEMQVAVSIKDIYDCIWRRVSSQVGLAPVGPNWIRPRKIGSCSEMALCFLHQIGFASQNKHFSLSGGQIETPQLEGGVLVWQWVHFKDTLHPGGGGFGLGGRQVVGGYGVINWVSRITPGRVPALRAKVPAPRQLTTLEEML